MQTLTKIASEMAKGCGMNGTVSLRQQRMALSIYSQFTCAHWKRDSRTQKDSQNPRRVKSERKLASVLCVRRLRRRRRNGNLALFGREAICYLFHLYVRLGNYDYDK